MRPVRKLARAALRRVGLERINPARDTAQLYRDDRDFHLGFERAAAHTGGTTSKVSSALVRQRHYTLVQLVRQSPLGRGDACELGCWHGLSSYQIAAAMVAAGATGALHLFDSFAGLSAPDAADEIEGSARRGGRFVPASLETVQRNLSEFPFIQYHQGWIPERFSDVAKSSFAFVHIDLVRYQPIRDSFLFFYPRLVDGGVMVFDDYGFTQFAGARKAIDEGLEKFGRPFFVTLPSGQAFLIKRGGAEV